jgi:hypothetical protein
MSKLVGLNVFVIVLVAAPLVLLETLKSRSAWVKRNSEILGIFVWLFTLLATYVWVLPMLGLKPNPRFFDQ